jgi:hypothetical protein
MSSNVPKNITDARLAHLINKEQLKKYIELNATASMAPGLVHFQQLCLQNLNWAGCKNITDDGLAYVKDLPLRTPRHVSGSDS